MDRKYCSPSSIPPGFAEKVLNSLPSASTPMNIPHSLPMKSMPSRNMYNFPTAVAASAPTETIPYVDMLLNSSAERRSLSPHRKMAGLQHERVRVLSCSDLESALTTRTYEGSKLYQDFPPPPPIPIFHHLPPIQSSPPRYVQQQAHRMAVGHNFPPLILGQQVPGFRTVGMAVLTGQQISRPIQSPVRPPPGFEVPLLSTPPSPLTPPQYPSPQPWSPARLAPMFHRTESVEQRNEQDVKSTGGIARGQSASMHHDGSRNNRYTEHSEKKNTGNRKSNIDQTQSNPGPSSEWDGNHEIFNTNTENHRLIERQVSNESSSSGKKKEKKKSKPKKERKKSKNSTDEKNNERSQVAIETFFNSTKGLNKAESDVTDDCNIENGLPLSNQNDNDTSLDAERDGEKMRKLKKKLKNQKKVEKFEPYLSLEEVQSGLADKTLIESEIRINQRYYKEAYISDPEDGQDIIIIGLKDRNRALDGDIVVVKLKDSAEWPKQKKGNTQRSGKVVFIKEQVHHRCTVGTLHMIDKGMILLIPRDQRFPLLRIRPQSIPIYILENLRTTNIESILFKASIISWVITRYANGIIRKKVGKKGKLVSETAAIFDELGLDRKPVPHFKKLIPVLPYEIPQEELTSRLDLRSEVIFTIDPPTARDLDDAVSIMKLSDDTFQVGVHISDVSHFLQEGTKLDRIISKRATTVYMVEQAYHMLPLTLCGLCSLNPGEDKLTISVIMTLSKDGVILDKEFRRSVIHSCAQLTYDQVQDVIEGKDAEFPEIYNNIEISVIKEAIMQLHGLAVTFRTKRFESGALKIDQPKLCFSLDKDNMPNSLAVYEIKDSHRLIEEFMLLANESVARFIHDRAPDLALLRRHDPPKHDMMSRIEKNLNELGICLDSSTAGNLHLSLSKYCDGDEMKAHVLYHLCARPMKRAVYFCSSPDTHHYALNMEKYTHFTSPIRRYADIIVHRILTACLDLSPMPKWDTEQINKFASVCNRKKYSAKRASELSCDLFRILYIKKIGSLIVDGVVVSVTSHSLNVILPSLAYNTRIVFEKLEDIKFDFVDKDMNSFVKIKWPGVEEVQDLKIFSCVKVLLVHTTSKALIPEITAVLLPPPNSPS